MTIWLDVMYSIQNEIRIVIIFNFILERNQKQLMIVLKTQDLGNLYYTSFRFTGSYSSQLDSYSFIIHTSHNGQ